jgi:glycosyltransferase involved in cell wall biosynthesis
MAAQNRHLVFNLVQLLPGVSGGIETYARELVPRLAERLEGWRLSALVNDEGMESVGSWSERLELIPAGFSWNSRINRLIYESGVGALKLRRLRPTLIHNLANTACLHPGAPQVTTVFDATQLLEPDPSRAMIAFRHLLRSAPARSDAVLTISRSAAGDIARACRTPEAKLRVVHLAARAPRPAAPRATLSERFGIAADAEYVLTPAARRPNKNIPGLLRAYASLPAESAPLLVLPGADGGRDEELTALIKTLGIGDRVLFPGWVDDDELDTLYTHALALIFPSLREGFGLPILEAMQCGCPVATSSRSSMPEIGGAAALYFDPTDDAAITGAIEQLTVDDALRARLTAAGRERAAQFSWERTADETVAAYEELIA